MNSLARLFGQKEESVSFWPFLLFLALCLCASCHPRSQELEPTIVFSPQPVHIERLPSAFPPLEPEESRETWGQELLIAEGFAKEFDLYRAITSYKRALFLLPLEKQERRLQAQYALILGYYLGQKYAEAVETFEKSDLLCIPPKFPATADLLVVLYDSYRLIGQTAKAERVRETIAKYNADMAQTLLLTDMLERGDLPALEASNDLEIRAFLRSYEQEKKSVRKAQALNAFFPGAGYYYVGQKKAALTSFLINTLFTAAAYRFFEQGNEAAGLITMSLELGWYIGGINGSGLAAKEWNERLYEAKARPLMNKRPFFPVLFLETAF